MGNPNEDPLAGQDKKATFIAGLEQRINAAKFPRAKEAATDWVAQLQSGKTDLAHMREIENEFYDIIGEDFAGIRAEGYPGWSDDEIKELYFLLYGELMEDEE
jgi:hypothetical protein